MDCYITMPRMPIVASSRPPTKSHGPALRWVRRIRAEYSSNLSSGSASRQENAPITRAVAPTTMAPSASTRSACRVSSVRGERNWKSGAVRAAPRHGRRRTRYRHSGTTSFGSSPYLVSLALRRWRRAMAPRITTASTRYPNDTAAGASKTTSSRTGSVTSTPAAAAVFSFVNPSNRSSLGSGTT